MSEELRGNAVRTQRATDEELDAIYEDFDRVLTAGQSTGKQMHLSDEGEDPICDDRWNGISDDTNLIDHPIEAFPKGWREVCLYCLQVWRERTGLV